MNVSQLIADLSAALGFEDAQHLAQGGQKLVLRGTLSNALAVVKIVLIQPGPNGDVTLQRAHREVELLSAVESDRVVSVLTDAVEIGDPTEAVCWAEEHLDGDDLHATLDHAWAEPAVWLLLSDMAEALTRATNSRSRTATSRLGTSGIQQVVPSQPERRSGRLRPRARRATGTQHRHAGSGDLRSASEGRGHLPEPPAGTEISRRR